MLSYLSSWFGGSDDDPGIIQCRDVVLDDTEEDYSSEWIWVDVETNKQNSKEEELQNVLQEYIIIPPYPTKDKQPTTSAVVASIGKRSKQSDRSSGLRKKKRYPKLKIYSPLKAASQCKIRSTVCSGSKNRRNVLPRTFIKKTSIHEQSTSLGFPLDRINYKGLEGFDGKQITLIVLRQESINEKIKPVEMDSRAITKPSDSWQYIPVVHPNCHETFDRLSAEGWSILIDKSGQNLSSSMVRLWCLNKGITYTYANQQSSLIVDNEIDLDTTNINSLVALLDNSTKRKRRKIMRKKNNTRRKRNELTTKPGHISLLVEEFRKRERVISHHRILKRDMTTCPDFSFGRGLTSLVRCSKDMLLALGMYITQILDTVSMDEEQHQAQKRTKAVVGKDVKCAQKLQQRKISKKMRGRKNLVRWNASNLKRCNKAMCMRRKAMGRGSFNCAVKRSYLKK